MIENLIAAWQFIFDKHPRADEIMRRIIDQDERITSGQFRIWYGEALEAN